MLTLVAQPCDRCDRKNTKLLVYTRAHARVEIKAIIYRALLTCNHGEGIVRKVWKFFSNTQLPDTTQALYNDFYYIHKKTAQIGRFFTLWAYFHPYTNRGKRKKEFIAEEVIQWLVFLRISLLRTHFENNTIQTHLKSLKQALQNFDFRFG